MSVRKAIFVGLLWVNGPIFPFLLGMPALAFVLMATFDLPLYLLWVGIGTGFIFAWLWWAISVPKWRLWALRNVENISQLYVKAVQTGLVWPRGHFFEKTEIRSCAHTIQERELELNYYWDSLREELSSLSEELVLASHALQNCISLPKSPKEKLASAKTLRELLSTNAELAEPQSKSYILTEFLDKLLERYIEQLMKCINGKHFTD